MSKQAIHVFAKWQVKPGELSAVLNLLPDVVRKSKSEEGNLFYSILQDNSDANTLILFEGYKDEAALAEHRSSDHFQTIVIGKIIPLLKHREITLTTPLSF